MFRALGLNTVLSYAGWKDIGKKGFKDARIRVFEDMRSCMEIEAEDFIRTEEDVFTYPQLITMFPEFFSWLFWRE